MMNVLLAATLILAPQAGQQDTVTAIRGAAILDLATGRIERGATLLLSGGRIIARGASVAVPAGARVVDATGLTLLPGLIDTHVHLTIAGRPRDNALSTLKAGFTTVADLGSANGLGVRVQRMIDADTIAGPRVIAAGSWIGGRGGVCEFGGATIRGATEARTRAQSDIAAGARILKLCITSWLDPVVANPDSIELTGDEISAVAEVARAAGVPLAAHAIGAAGARAAVKAGVRQLAHTPVVNDDDARAIAKSGACVSTTMTSLLQSPSSPALRASFARLRAAGVRLALGTDAGVLPHGSNGDELGTLVSLGMTPAEALLAATTVAAQCLGIDNYGVLDTGARADIIGVRGDPLSDIAIVKQPALVVRNGRIVVAPAGGTN